MGVMPRAQVARSEALSRRDAKDARAIDKRMIRFVRGFAIKSREQA